MTDRRVRTMADTKHPAPTDAELDELRQANGGKYPAAVKRASLDLSKALVEIRK